MGYDCCAGAYGRRYYTKEEKVEWLSGYAQELEQELKAVKERIEDLKKS